MANKDPKLDENLGSVEKFLRDHATTLGKLSDLEIAKEQAKTTESLPTQSMTSSTKEPGTATKAAKAVEQLQKETTEIRNAQQELLNAKQTKGLSNTGR